MPSRAGSAAGGAMCLETVWSQHDFPSIPSTLASWKASRSRRGTRRILRGGFWWAGMDPPRTSSAYGICRKKQKLEPAEMKAPQSVFASLCVFCGHCIRDACRDPPRASSATGGDPPRASSAMGGDPPRTSSATGRDPPRASSATGRRKPRVCIRPTLGAGCADITVGLSGCATVGAEVADRQERLGRSLFYPDRRHRDPGLSRPTHS